MSQTYGLDRPFRDYYWTMLCGICRYVCFLVSHRRVNDDPSCTAINPVPIPLTIVNVTAIAGQNGTTYSSFSQTFTNFSQSC